MTLAALCAWMSEMEVRLEERKSALLLVTEMAPLSADGVASIYFEQVFLLHGIPRKIISDRGPQFAARSMCALYKHLGINGGLTTAYHPQANGQVEHKNQEVEVYLHLFISKRQDDWVDLLPTAKFVVNS